MLFRGARMAMNTHGSLLEMAPTASQQKFREYCVSSAHDMISLTRKFRAQYGLRYAPLVSVYSLTQACRCMAECGTVEEVHYLTKALEECANTWQLAREIGRPRRVPWGN